MSYIDVEDAVQIAQQREDAVKAASAVIDKDVVTLKERFCVPDDPSQWAPAFATILTSRNKEYRHLIKQEIAAAAHNLKHLYSEGGDSDTEEASEALRMLVSIVIQALEAKNRMAAQLAEYRVLHENLIESGSLSLPDRVFIRKTLPDLERCSRRLESDAVEMKEQFDLYKQSLYIIAFEHELRKCQETLSARKTTRERVESQARPVFRQVTALYAQRQMLIEEAGTLGLKHGMEWFSLPTGRLSLDKLNEQLEEYDALVRRINTHSALHTEALRRLDDIQERALWSPLTLPGPNGSEIPVDRICGAFRAYEGIYAMCTGMLQFSQPIIETLNSYLVTLRQRNVICALMST
ncbi:hypothetical protein GY45DRAFT_1376352 [Cubamyces sp. BRFM 1775]|nr:hypothetical protein GY45DRAFT_1376352 [Cubamyces sp. BRFM 1775]